MANVSEKPWIVVTCPRTWKEKLASLSKKGPKLFFKFLHKTLAWPGLLTNFSKKFRQVDLIFDGICLLVQLLYEDILLLSFKKTSESKNYVCAFILDYILKNRKTIFLLFTLFTRSAKTYSTKSKYKHKPHISTFHIHTQLHKKII
jgi:hypothetical protein